MFLRKKVYVDKFYKNVDEKGRRWMSDNLTASEVSKGESGKPWHGIDPTTKGNHWKFAVYLSWMNLRKKEKFIFLRKPVDVPRYKRYLDEMKGQLLQDVWEDILPVTSTFKRAVRVSYTKT